jgi:Ni/Co efflux regulator RcnB
MKLPLASLLAMGFALSVAYAPAALAQSDHTDHKAAPAAHDDTHAAPGARPDTHAAPAARADAHAAPAPRRSVPEARNDQRRAPAYGHADYNRQRGRWSGHQLWATGGRFGGGRAIFSNWGLYNLRPPSYGYEWVQDGGELVLIDIDTGLIVQVFMIPD